jgi:hypothetical protein
VVICESFEDFPRFDLDFVLKLPAVVLLAQVNEFMSRGLSSVVCTISGVPEYKHIIFPCVMGDAMTGGFGRDLLPYAMLQLKG